MYSHRNQRLICSHINRSGFTLVEMLVALALVMLMMTMFATIFQMATGSATKQRIIAETDQRSRQLTTILRADFAKRSFRNTFPFLPNEDPTQTRVPFAARTGYVYVSCNNVSSAQDDIIQFTVDARQLQTNSDDSRFYGASALLFDEIYGTVDGTNPSLPYSPNQPEADDGELVPNGTSSSNAAEISLFLRGGNLIRRIMLIRDPLPVAGQELETQPMSSILNPFFQTDAAGGSFYLGAAPTVAQDDFWRYFDFSAVPTNMANAPNGVEFVGIDALSNEGDDITASFGIPNFRFGFNPVTGLSREHEGTASTARFIGRYLQAETSANFVSISEDFNWPNSASSLVAWGPVNSITPLNNNPLDIRNAVSLNPTTGLVEQFDGSLGRGGPRRVEDVLMSNVREFRIELWDSRLERWVVPGHAASRTYLDSMGNPYQVAGDYHILRNAQRDPDSGLFTYGPLEIPGVNSGTPHAFDTWHPEIARDFDSDGAAVEDIAERQAPYYPLRYYPPRQNDSPPGPSPSSIPPSAGINPATEFDPISGRPNANRGFWAPGAAYYSGDVVFANDLTPGWDGDGDGVFEWDQDSSDIPQQSVHWAYRCIRTTTGLPTGTSGAIAPGWQSPGLTFLDNDLLWEGFQNYQPLKSVRLTISFIEPNSETPKQLTLVLPLTDAAQ
ncbi:MAG: prepilin-type N-terminal cleavage/methylation domain-containing protein [Planctomycetaceae bacterium]